MGTSRCKCYVKCQNLDELRSLLRVCAVELPFVSDWLVENIGKYQDRFPVYVHISEHKNTGAILNIDVIEPSGQYAVVIDYEKLSPNMDKEK